MAPAVVGANRTLVTQEPPGPIEPTQFDETSVKSGEPADKARLLTVSVVLPLLVSVMDSVLLLRVAVSFGKARLPAERLTAPWMPVPDRAASFHWFQSPIRRLPVTAFRVVGLKRTVVAQLLPTATHEVQLVDTKLKEASPVTELASGGPSGIGPMPVFV